MAAGQKPTVGGDCRFSGAPSAGKDAVSQVPRKPLGSSEATARSTPAKSTAPGIRARNFVRARESPPVNKSRGSFVTQVTLALEDLAFLHDERDPLRGRDVLGRVAGHGDDVGALPG